MFIGYYELGGKEYCAIYYKNRDGYLQWCRDIFSPMCENIKILDFTIKGKTYKERKGCLYDIAVEWSNTFFSIYCWSYGELAEICDYFYRNGKRYGLLEEFKENAIC